MLGNFYANFSLLAMEAGKTQLGKMDWPVDGEKKLCSLKQGDLCAEGLNIWPWPMVVWESLLEAHLGTVTQ